MEKLFIKVPDTMSKFLDLRRLALIAILASLCIVSRQILAPFPNIKPITAIFLVVAIYMGFVDALLLAIITMTATSISLGLGIWVLFQCISYMVALLVWKCLEFPSKLLPTKGKILIQSVLAGLMAFLYGISINILTALYYSTNIWIIEINALYFDLAHAISTALFYPIILSIFRRFYHNEKNI